MKTTPIFNPDGSPAEESIALLAVSFVEVLHEIRCNPFYWCGTPVLADRERAMIEACKRVFDDDGHSISDDRFRNLWHAAEERGWSTYVEQVSPKVNESVIAGLFDDDGRPKPEAVEKARADHDSRAAEAERLSAALARLG